MSYSPLQRFVFETCRRHFGKGRRDKRNRAMSTIEHEETRQSLACAFESIFSKFDRPFSDDDEVDIGRLKVVKKGSTLRHAPRRPFGSVFRREGDNKSSDHDDEDSGSTTLDEDANAAYMESLHKKLASNVYRLKGPITCDPETCVKSMSDKDLRRFLDIALFKALLRDPDEQREAVLACTSDSGPITEFDRAALDILLSDL